MSSSNVHFTGFKCTSAFRRSKKVDVGIRRKESEKSHLSVEEGYGSSGAVLQTQKPSGTHKFGWWQEDRVLSCILPTNCNELSQAFLSNLNE